MSNGDDEYGYAGGGEPPERPPDPMVDRAKEALITFFESRRRETFYERQLQVLFESKGTVSLTPLDRRGQGGEAESLTLDPGFYHWITAKALRELVAENVIAMESGDLGEAAEGDEERTINFYRHPSHRFWKRQATEILRLVQQFSATAFRRALGQQAEMMFDAGMARAGFVTRATNVREWEGRQGHGGKNLDRVYERDGVVWVAEIKNRLKYIDARELYAKLDLCDTLRLKPLFIARMMPGTYVKRVENRGGFCLIFKHQFYPFAQEAFAGEVRQRLELPIGDRLAERTIRRFIEKGHEPHLRRLALLPPGLR